ncbi:MAG: hypothetical protein WDO73_29070 [Ignavibacteriota bacterium]
MAYGRGDCGIGRDGWGALYWFFGRAKPAASVSDTPTAATPAATATGNPVEKFVEVSGVRFSKDTKGIDVSFVVVNHSDQDLVGLTGSANVFAKSGEGAEIPVGSVKFQTSIPASGSKELTLPFDNQEEDRGHAGLAEHLCKGADHFPRRALKIRWWRRRPEDLRHQAELPVPPLRSVSAQALQILARLVEVGIESEGLLEIGCSGGRLSEGGQRDPAIIEGQRIAGIEGDGAAQFLDGALVFLLVEQHLADRGGNFGVVRLLLTARLKSSNASPARTTFAS